EAESFVACSGSPCRTAFSHQVGSDTARPRSWNPAQSLQRFVRQQSTGVERSNGKARRISLRGGARLTCSQGWEKWVEGWPLSFLIKGASSEEIFTPRATFDESVEPRLLRERWLSPTFPPP